MKKPRNSRDTTGSGADTAGHTERYFDRPEDLARWNPAEDLGLPGEYPFTRGIYPLQYRSRLWTMRQYAGFGTARESNQRYRYLLSKGTTGLSVAFDLPTQVGLDSDHPLAQGEVGRVGVAIDSLEDMEALFDGIPLDRVSTSMTINATAPILLALYFAVAERQGADIKRLSGTVQNDIQGIHRPWNLHLSAAPRDAPGDGHFCFLPRPRPRMEYHFRQWLSHSRSRSDRRAGGRLHAWKRHCLHECGH